MVREIEDPALVPEYWVCNMNSDESINDCSKGEGDDVDHGGINDQKEHA